MATSFILRFQEQCEKSGCGEIIAGLKTITIIQGEQADSASTDAAFKTLIAGTSTVTRVKSERGDSDYADSNRTLPIAPTLGTMTKTAVNTESVDQKPSHHEITVLPKCS